MPAAPTTTSSRRLVVVAGFLLALGAACLREYLVNIRPNTLAFARQQHLLYYWQAYAFMAFLLAAVFTGVALLVPVLSRITAPLGVHWRPVRTAAILLAVSGTLAGHTVHLSNLQFGAFDQSILVDTLWRQMQGQIAYRDLPTTNPPLFVLPLKWAALVFGTRWAAQGYLLAIFSMVTFFWTYWLLRRLDLSRPLALLLTAASQISGLLVLSFWWFNSITAVIAGIFDLSALLLLMRPKHRAAQASYVAALALLTLVKPNTAGLLGVLVPLVLLLVVRERLRLLVLTAGALVLSAGFLVLNGVRPSDVLQSYAGVAKSRGLVFLALHINPFFTGEAYFQFACLSFAFFPLLPALIRTVRQHQWRDFGHNLILLIGGAVGIVGATSNGDLVDVGLAPVLLTGGLVAFAPHRRRSALFVFYTALLCALMSTQIYKAESRLRNRVMGFYFDDSTSIVPVQNAFFDGMRTGPQMNDMLLEIGAALAHNPGPVFFAPRLEWAYAAFRLPSPRGLPVFWQSGTSFAAADEPRLLEDWDSRRFGTVLQGRLAPHGRKDWIYFPQSFQDRLAAHYTPDDTTYPDLIVWHRRPGT